MQVGPGWLAYKGEESGALKVEGCLHGSLRPGPGSRLGTGALGVGIRKWKESSSMTELEGGRGHFWWAHLAGAVEMASAWAVIRFLSRLLLEAPEGMG